MKKILFILAACLLGIGLFAGCSTDGKSTSTSSTSASNDTAKYNLSGISFQSIDDQTYADIFKNNKMTMVNIMATWCSPCVKELPELQRLNGTLQEKNIGLVAVVTDTFEKGKVNEQAVKDAMILQNQAGITFPMLIPDKSGLDGVLSTVQAVPTTIFIDQNGNVIGSVTGSRDYQEWASVVSEMESKLG